MSLLRDLLKLPFHILSVGSQAKSFQTNPVIGNRWLNRAGLHVLRLILAHAVMRLRRFLIAWRLPAKDRQEFARNGYLIKHELLPVDVFSALSSEVEKLISTETAADSIQGDTLTRKFLLSNHRRQRYPTIRLASENQVYQDTLAYVAGRNRTPFQWVQVIRSDMVASDEPDPQGSLHVDTFQPNMKAWLYISGASQKNGMFTYVPGSHRLSWARIKWEYRQSIVGRDQASQYAARGSFRITPEALEQMGLPPARALHCPGNTLVVADTCGFHCRGTASDPKARRVEIWSISRTNPFNPFPGLSFKFLDRFERSIFARLDPVLGKKK